MDTIQWLCVDCSIDAIYRLFHVFLSSIVPSLYMEVRIAYVYVEVPRVGVPWLVAVLSNLQFFRTAQVSQTHMW